MEGFDVHKLSALLKPNDEDSDSEDEKPAYAKAKLTPGDIGPAQRSQKEDVKTTQPPSKDIWEQDEVQEGAEFDDIHDPRPEPEYDIVYKQAITSEDMFLQMGNKTPATASCEDMIVKVKLPTTKLADVDLDVKQNFLACRTPKYKLGLHLPHPVDPKSGKAQWDGDKELLTVTMRMARDYDFINF